ncbi:MAG: hypothetical protein CM15mV87_170 [Caudoviricetes sp.]|nr:MAG: hypothetical protein CM15mV87_170 [Caudoviricetes sp.]
MQPHNNHKYKSVTIISVVITTNFNSRFNTRSVQNHFTKLNNKLNNNTNLLGQAKVVNSEDKIVGTWGEYNEIIRNGKIFGS